MMKTSDFIDMIITASDQPSAVHTAHVKSAAVYIGTAPNGVPYPRAVIAELQRRARGIAATQGSKEASAFLRSWNQRFQRLVSSVWTKQQIDLWLSAFMQIGASKKLSKSSNASVQYEKEREKQRNSTL